MKIIIRLSNKNLISSNHIPQSTQSALKLSLNWESKTSWTHLKKGKSTKDKKLSNKDNKNSFNKLKNVHLNQKSTTCPNLLIKIKRKKSKSLISSKMIPKI